MLENNTELYEPVEINPILKKMFDTALAVPLIKVNRITFLEERFSVESDQKDMIIKAGPASIFDKEVLSKATDKRINKLTMESSVASFGLGFASNPLIMAGTISADILQNMGFALRLAQEIGYIYGIDDIFSEDGGLNEQSYNTLLLYLGVMFGAQGAGSLLRTITPNVAKYVSKQIIAKPLTKGVVYPLLKKISIVVASKTLTKLGLAKAVAKAVPVVGGVVGGSITFATMKPMATKLKNELSKLIDYSDSDMEQDLKIIDESANGGEASGLV